MRPDYDTLIDTQTWAFIAKTAQSFPDDTATRPIKAQRAIYNAMCRQFYAGRPDGVEVLDHQIASVPVRTYSSGDAAARVLFFHGGGFVVGGLDSHDDVCAEICDQTGFEVTAVDYRLAPEHLFPADHNDACTVWQHLASRPGPIILVGDSAGGALCAGLAHTLRAEPRQPAGQVLIYPGLGAGLETESMTAHAHAPMLTRADCALYQNFRLGDDPSLLNDPRCCPLRAEDFSGLPPTVIFAAQCDPLCDDARLYTAQLTRAGVAARCFVEPGLVHGYLRARHSVDRAREGFGRIVAAIKDLGTGLS